MNVIVVKNRLWDMLRDAVDINDYLEKAESILSALKLTDGLWAENGYAYKAGEIADCIADMLWQESSNCHHQKTLERMARVRADAMKVSEHFHEIQGDQLFGMDDVESRPLAA